VTAADVVVVGAGPAGLAAAAAAARAGASTVLVDAYERPGGQYFRQPASVTRNRSGVQERGRHLAARALSVGVEFRPHTAVWDATPTDLHLVTGGTVSTLAFRAAVVATGAHERVAAFPGWTLPGVYAAGAVQALLKEHDLVPGRRVLVAGSGPLPLVVAAALVHRPVRVAGVLEATRLAVETVRHPWIGAAGLWAQGARMREGLVGTVRLLRHRVPVRTGWGIVRALGDSEVEAAEVARLDPQWRPVAGSERTVECDTLAVHHGLVPNTDVLRLIGADVVRRPDLGGWVPVRTPWLETSIPGVFAAGDCAGIGGAALSLVEGDVAGAAAACHALGREPVRHTARQRAALARERRFQRLYAALFAARPGLTGLPRPDTVVCRCEETTRGEIDAAIAAGARTTALVKSTTRCGMGPCQGRICLPLVEQLTATATGVPPVPVTARAPLVPIPFDAVRRC